MKRILCLAAFVLLLPASIYAQARLQIISLNQNARTFIKNGDSWELATFSTAIDANTVFKNYSDPPSRIVIRDWEKNLQYDITLDQEEFAISTALEAGPGSYVSRHGGKMIPFVVKAISESKVPTLHNSRSIGAVSKRGTDSLEDLHQEARCILAGLAGSDRIFHADSLGAAGSAYPIGLHRVDSEHVVLTNYTGDKTLYFSLFSYDRSPKGKIAVTPVQNDSFFAMPPQAETVIPAAQGRHLILIATEEMIDQNVMAINLERQEGKAIIGNTTIPAGAAAL